MKLFICMTPLQTLVANQIILREGLDKSNCILLYISFSNNEINRTYYDKLAKNMFYSEYITSGRTLETVFKLRKLLFNKTYDLYVASIDDTLIHYALSFPNLQRLTTFDDGTANIIPQGPYFLGVKRSLVRGIILKIFHYLLGNRYSLTKIKNRTNKHYSIYKGYTNAVNNPTYISLFDVSKHNINGKEINVFLGTVYSEAASSPINSHLLWESVVHFLSQLPNHIYIPHPRENIEHLPHSVKMISENLLAEEYIIALRECYETVNVYGFGSSAQFNLLNINDINIYPVNSRYVKDLIVDTVDLLSKSSNSIKNID